MSYGVPVNDRTTARPRPDAGSSPLSKAEKRAAAKAAKARAAAAAKRRQVLAVTGAAVAAVAVIALVVVLVVRGGGSSSPADSTAAPSSAADTAAATEAPFPPVPADADPALSTRPEVKAGGGSLANLVKTTLIEGKGPQTQQGQTITVNYVGVTYADGKEFDASWNGKQAFSFKLGGGNVIPGWDQGLVGIKVGSRVQLDIPANLAYGDKPTGGRPAGALRFVVDVLSAS
ncbi:FKBP-type peptidyl-prolyl cis-trans isomerase [Dactylosporangium sp. CA-233914]|uniref:FKBP-type peptidyl-prolyl cis-trans isomerase n=1 Tax=Dactylosporangium sp. CA-233914 TaxID=3239934 RepID=UPI003D8D4BCD